MSEAEDEKTEVCVWGGEDGGNNLKGVTDTRVTYPALKSHAGHYLLLIICMNLCSGGGGGAGREGTK